MDFYDFSDINNAAACLRFVQEILPTLGYDMRNNRIQAKWRGGDGFNVAVDEHGWFDHRTKDKGGVIDLCALTKFHAKSAKDGFAKQQAQEFLGQWLGLTPRNRTEPCQKTTPYDYFDETGRLLYRKTRFEPGFNGEKKTFVFSSFDANGKEIKGAGCMKNVRRIPYRLPQLIQAVKNGDRIFLVEGEKDVDSMTRFGLAATSTKDWQDAYCDYLKDAKSILIIADNDKSAELTGQHIAAGVQSSLARAGISASVAYADKGKDATEWIEAGATAADFMALAANPPPWSWTPEMAAAIDGDEIPPRFGDVLQDTANAEYPALIGKVKMPDEAYYSFEVSAASDSMYNAICKAKATVVKSFIEAHIEEKKFDGVKPKDLTEIQNMSIVMWLRSCGDFYRNAETHRIEDLLYFNRRTGRLLRLASDEFSAWVSNGARINRADKEFLRVMAFLQDAGMDDEVSIETTPQAFVARRNDAIYVSCGESKIVRCRDGRCELVRNGTNGVLFPCEYTLREWQLLPDERQVRDPFETTMQFNDLAYGTWYCKYLLRAWYLNLFACHANHTPLLLTGDRNSGKSATARALREMGGFPKREAGIDPKKEEDFWVSVNGKGILFFDNVEDEIVSAKWLNSAIEKVTTGGGKEVRKLYTHNSTNYNATSDIIFASKIPHYTANEGVAHRFVIVNLNASICRYRGDELLKEIHSRRDESLTWTVRTIAQALVANVSIPANVNERYPDFGEFTLRCAAVLDDYDKTLTALQCGEIEKSRIVLVNDPTANDIYSFLREYNGTWEGELQEIARWATADTQPPDNDQQLIRNQAMRYAHTIRRLRKPFEICFKSVSTRKSNGMTKYAFGGLNDLIKGNL